MFSTAKAMIVYEGKTASPGQSAIAGELAKALSGVSSDRISRPDGWQTILFHGLSRLGLPQWSASRSRAGPTLGAQVSGDPQDRSQRRARG